MKEAEVMSNGLLTAAPQDGTDGQLRALTIQGKRLKVLRDKRDRLRADLEETEQEIRRTVADMTKLTAQLADEDNAPINGKGKK